MTPAARHLLTITGLLSFAGPAAAQADPVPSVTTHQAGTSRAILGTPGQTPRLTSVGDRLLWLSGDQVLHLDVTTAGLVSLLVTSPAIDPSDYRRDGEYGDETYDAQTAATTYTLTAPDGRVVSRRTYPAQLGLAQDLLHVGRLPAGRYTLTVHTTGKAKNAFALNVAGARVSADRVNITVLSHDWVTLATVQPSAQESVLTIYDTDGAQELDVQVSYADGSAQRIRGNGDLDERQVHVPGGLTEPALLQARLPPTARQHSNTIGLSVAGQEVAVSGPPAAPVRPPMTPPAAVQPAPAQPPAPLPTPAPPRAAAPAPTRATPPQASPAAPLAVAAPLTYTRDSAVTLTLDAPAGGTLLVAHTLPDGTTFVPGSVTDDAGRPIDARLGKSGRLYLTVSSDVHRVTYHLTHSGALSVLAEPAIARQTEQGTDLLQGQIDLDDARTAQRPKPGEVQKTAGVLRFPLDGAVIQTRSTTVQVNYAGAEPQLRVNGQLVSPDLIGKRVTGPDYGELTYVAVPLTPGENRIEAAGEEVTVRVPGAATRVAFTPVSLSGDARTPSAIQVEVQDDAGLPVRVPNVTLLIEGAQPLNPDAIPGAPGYQLALEDGRALLRLKPQSGGRVTLAASTYAGRQSFTLSPGSRQVIVGRATLTVSGASPEAPGPLHTQLSGQATVDVPVGGGQLRLNADGEGLQNLTGVQDQRHLMSGDASALQNDLISRGPVAAEYRSAAFSARYALKAAVNPLSGVAYDADGAAVEVRVGDAQVSAYHALLNAGAQQVTADPLTGIIVLGAGVVPGSERVTLRGTLQGVTQARTLTRGVDYTLVYDTGTLILTRPVTVTDPDLDAPELTVTFDRPGDAAQRAAAWGAATRYAWNGPAGPSGEAILAAVHEQGNTTFGVKATLSDTGRLIRFLGLISTGARAELSVKQAIGRGALTLNAVTQTPGYQGVLASTPGTAINAEVSAPVTERFGIRARADYSSAAQTLGGEVLGTVTGGDWRAGVGLGASSDGNVYVVGEGALSAPVAVKLRHVQSLTGHPSETQVSAAVPVGPHLALKAEDRVTWTDGEVHQVGTVGLTGRLGISQYDLTYELPGASGEAGRIRAGVTADLPVNDHLSFGVRATTYLRPTFTAQGSVDARYREDHLLATVGVDLTWQGAVTAGVRTSLTYSEGPWTTAVSGQSTFGVRSGHKYAAGLAYRGETLNVLSTAQFEAGALAPQGGLVAWTTDATYHLPKLDVRAGLGVRAPTDFSVITWQAYAGSTYWITPRFGLGGLYRLTGQAPTGVTSHALGLEATAVPAPGVGVTAGYMLTPVHAVTLQPGQGRGLYVRVDLLLNNQK